MWIRKTSILDHLGSCNILIVKDIIHSVIITRSKMFKVEHPRLAIGATTKGEVHESS